MGALMASGGEMKVGEGNQTDETGHEQRSTCLMMTSRI